MEATPPPVTLAEARAWPIPDGRRSAELFRDGALELRLYAPRGDDRQTPHDRDEIYIVAAGTARYRLGEAIHAVAAGDVLFAAAHMPHRFEAFSADFAVWVVFYGPQK
jgi:mannose-6-phosphate isomerase-like protein (cupin superfamily)